MPTRVRSHAKINLGLGIGAPRPDGFHSLTTVYQTLEIHDLVTVSAKEAGRTEIRLTSNDHRVPTDHRNTAWKMVELALEALGLSAQVDIHIEKRLPVQGGLGAGSGNAVAALVGLERELQGTGDREQGLGIAEENAGPSTTPVAHSAIGSAQDDNPKQRGDDNPKQRGDDNPRKRGDDNLKKLGDKDRGWGARRLEIAGRVGSDVPLFLIGGTVLGLDRGQEVYPLPDIEPTWCVVAAPAEGVSTPQAFRDWDALCTREGLTPEESTDKLNKLSRAYASAFAQRQGAGSSGVLPVGEDLAGPQESALVRTGITSWIQNDFERVVFPQHPSLAEIKRLLAAAGSPVEALHAAPPLVASLSGSGSALFGLYLTRREAEAACDRLQRAGIQFFLTRTLPREPYWRDMFEVS